MASLRARHSSSCAIPRTVTGKGEPGPGRETAAPTKEGEKIAYTPEDGPRKGERIVCTCKPAYSIRGAAGKGHKSVGRDFRTALRELRKVQVAADEGEEIAPPIKFEAWADEWIASLDGPKENTLVSYRPTIAYAVAAFGSVQVRKLTPAHILSMNTAMREAGLSDSTRAKHLRVLNGCLKAASRRYGARNPFDRIERNERPTVVKKESAYFEDAELPPLFAQVPEGLYRTMFLVALKTGMRQGELSALQWGDVDLLGAEITVRRNFTAGRVTTPKNKKTRTVGLTSDVVDLLGGWWDGVAVPTDADLVFPAETGGHLLSWNITRGVLYPAMKLAGVERVGPTEEKRTFHSFRHTYARIAMEKGREISWLSRQLGHSSIKVTQDVYGHFSKDAARQQTKMMEGAFPV